MRYNNFVWMLSSVMVLTGCRTLDPDRQNELDPLTRQSKEQIAQALTRSIPLPAVKPRLFLKPVAPKPKPTALSKVISLTITDVVPLKDVFFQMARQAGVNLSLAPAVQGTATLHVHQQPFLEVVRELCLTNKLRYRLDNTILRIEPDEPYLNTYNVQFLSLVRHNQSRSSITTDVFTPSSQNRSNAQQQSNNVLTSEIKNDLWAELKVHLATILKASHTGKDPGNAENFAVHQQAGLLSVFATQAQHQEIDTFLKMLRLSLSSQVIIEAKIVEVILKDEFKTGINWNLIKGDMVLQAPLGDFARPGRFVKEATPARDVFTIGGQGKQLTDLLHLMKRFGNVRTLASPRLNAMNNVTGYMKVATEYVYFSIDYNRDFSYNSSREHEHVSSRVQSIPIGLVLVVHPSINLEDGSVTLALRPTISRVVNEKLDPAVAIISKESQRSYVPEVQIREFDSLVHLKSGQIGVIGGLMEELAKNDQSAVPFISDLPGIGDLAKATSDNRLVSELVIFVKVKIVDPQDNVEAIQESSVTPADQALYENFTFDPRPL